MKIYERPAFFILCENRDSGALELKKVCFTTEYAINEKKKLDCDDLGAFVLKAILVADLEE